MTVWVIEQPADEAFLAEWAGTVDFETVHCPVSPGHQRAGRRAGPLRVKAPRRSGDFLWTQYGERLVRPWVLDRFREAQLHGFTSVAAEVENSAGGPALDYRELLVTGWAGVAPVASGVTLDTKHSCEHCGLLVYSAPASPERLFVPAQWDGSDFFMIWPFPRFLFASERAAAVIGSAELTGVALRELPKLGRKSATLSPGRLSYWMPEELARERGQALGIA